MYLLIGRNVGEIQAPSLSCCEVGFGLACERRRISGCQDSIFGGENLDSRKYVCVRRLGLGNLPQANLLIVSLQFEACSYAGERREREEGGGGVLPLCGTPTSMVFFFFFEPF